MGRVVYRDIPYREYRANYDPRFHHAYEVKEGGTYERVMKRVGNLMALPGAVVNLTHRHTNADPRVTLGEPFDVVDIEVTWPDAR